MKVSFLAREREFFVPYRATSYRTVTLREYLDRDRDRDRTVPYLDRDRDRDEIFF